MQNDPESIGWDEQPMLAEPAAVTTAPAPERYVSPAEIEAEKRRFAIRSVVKGAYDLQKIRIQTGLRIVANYKSRIGQAPGQLESEISKDAQDLLAKMRAEYDLITDAIAEKRSPHKGFVGRELIDAYAEYVMVDSYVFLSEREDLAFKNVARIVYGHPVSRFFKDVRGIGPVMAAVMISEINIFKTPRISNLWSLAGLDVAPDGRGRSMRKEHLIDREYIDKDGNLATKKSITYNPFLKTKLMGVAANCMVIAGGGGKYREIYDNYKHRLQHRPDLAEESKAHIDAMSKRYMVKMMLQDLWMFWRAEEGLEITESYAEAKLGIVHGGYAGDQ